MSAIVQISRDTEGVRLETQDAGDARVLSELGPYVYVQDGCEFAFMADPDGINECSINDIIRGLRFPDFRSGNGQGVKSNRFGPIEIEADICNPEGFSVDLPPLHERPWPNIRENEGCYDVGEQMVLTLAERINDRIDFCGMPVKDAIRLENRKIPSDLRRFLPVGNAEAIIRCQMAKLRLPSASH
jgi:hypothetical protein